MSRTVGFSCATDPPMLMVDVTGQDERKRMTFVLSSFNRSLLSVSHRLRSSTHSVICLEDIYAFHTVGICDRFYEFLASHITRPPSKYDVRLNNTARNSIQFNNGIGKSDLETREVCSDSTQLDISYETSYEAALLRRASSSLCTLCTNSNKLPLETQEGHDWHQLWFKSADSSGNGHMLNPSRPSIPQGTFRGGGGRGSQIQKIWEAVKRLNRLAPNLVHVGGFVWEWT